MNQLTTTDIRTGFRQAMPFGSRVEASCILGSSFTEALVDPGGVFREPDEVMEHPWFSHEEKRTILLSWARDEFVLEQVVNKALPELKPRSRIDAVIEVLSRLDAPAAAEYRAAAAAIRARHAGQSSKARGFTMREKAGGLGRRTPCRSV